MSDDIKNPNKKHSHQATIDIPEKETIKFEFDPLVDSYIVLTFPNRTSIDYSISIKNVTPGQMMVVGGELSLRAEIYMSGAIMQQIQGQGGIARAPGPMGPPPQM